MRGMESLHEDLLVAVLSRADFRAQILSQSVCRTWSAVAHLMPWPQILVRIEAGEGQIPKVKDQAYEAWKARCDTCELPYAGLFDEVPSWAQRALFVMTYVHACSVLEQPEQLVSASSWSDFAFLARLHFRGEPLIQRVIELEALPYRELDGPGGLVFATPELRDDELRSEWLDSDYHKNDLLCIINQTNGRWVSLPTDGRNHSESANTYVGKTELLTYPNPFSDESQELLRPLFERQQTLTDRDGVLPLIQIDFCTVQPEKICNNNDVFPDDWPADGYLMLRIATATWRLTTESDGTVVPDSAGWDSLLECGPKAMDLLPWLE